MEEGKMPCGDWPTAARLNEHAWNKHARRFSQEHEQSFHIIDFGDLVFPTNDDLRMINGGPGVRALEIGAGTCNCGIALAIAGSDVTCVDISEQQLRIGAQNAARLGASITTYVGNMETVAEMNLGLFDLVISIAALNYVGDLGLVFRSVRSLLKEHGVFVFSVPHPAMSVIDAAYLSPGEGADSRYSYSGVIRWKWQEDDGFELATFRRSAAEYLNALVTAGFALSRIEGLMPLRDDESWSETERTYRQMFPSYLVVKATTA